MSDGKFEWLKDLKERPKYAEVVERVHDEVSLKDKKVRERGFAVTEARTE